MCSFKIINNKISNSNKGVTLVELLVTLAIVGILITMAFSINSFAQKVYTKGERLSDVQYNMRMASDFITKEVRFSGSVQILEAADIVPASITNDDSYIFTETAGSEILLKYKDKNMEKIVATATTLNLLFSTDSPYKTLYFKLTGDKNGEDFELDSEVLVLNLPSDGIIIDNTGSNDGVKLKCNKTISTTLSTGLNFQPAPPNGLKNTYYSHTFSASGGVSPYYYTVTNGALPTGLALSSDGILSGNLTLSSVGSFMFNIKLMDSSSPAKSVSRYFEVIITDPDNPLPIASNLVISGTQKVGGTLTANYSYNDPGGDEEAASTVMWYRMDNASGGGKILVETDASTASTPATYTITSGDYNKYIIFEIIPRTASGEAGATAVSFPTSAISNNIAPTANSVSILGTTKVGAVLTGQYTYYDADTPSDTEGISQFKWYRSDKNNGSKLEMVEIPGAVNLQYTLTSTDLNKYIYFEVTPVAKSGTLNGEPIISANVGKITN